MAEMTISGKIIRIDDKRSGESARTGNKWTIQKYVLETEGQYTKHCMFSVFGEDKISQFNIKLNQRYDVSIEIDAREYNGIWYNEIRAWKVVLAQGESADQPASQSVPQPTQQQIEKAEQAFMADNDNEELPF